MKAPDKEKFGQYIVHDSKEYMEQGVIQNQVKEHMIQEEK